MKIKKTEEQIEREILIDASTRTTASRAQLRADLNAQIQEYLNAGGKIRQVEGSVANRDVFNRPVSQHSARILESFTHHKKGPGR